jgi:hypothetical protein
VNTRFHVIKVVLGDCREGCFGIGDRFGLGFGEVDDLYVESHFRFKGGAVRRSSGDIRFRMKGSAVVDSTSYVRPVGTLFFEESRSRCLMLASEVALGFPRQLGQEGRTGEAMMGAVPSE